MRGDDGSISEWIGTYTDIHDRRAFEQQLRESETRFRALCETVPAMIWMSDAQGDCVYWNPRWYDFTGQAEDQAMDQGWWDVMHPDDATRVRDAFEQSLQQRGEFLAEYRVRRHDGQYRWCIDNASPHFASDGRFLGHIGSLTDISERKHIEDATASDRAILSLITTGAPLQVVLDAIALSVEARGEIPLYCAVMVLDEVRKTLSFGSAPHFPIEYRGPFEASPIGLSGPPCARSAYLGRQVICEDIQADPSFSDHHAVSSALGIVACCVTPILDSNGQVLGTLNIYYDRTHLPSLREQAMARSASHLAGIVIERTRGCQARCRCKQKPARGQAEHASRVKDEFLATLSHELRTPLNAILGWSRLMQSDIFEPANLGKGMVIIERSARAQTQIIDDLLDMSAILSGKIRLQPEHFDIAGLARSTVELMQPAAFAREISLELDAPTQGELWFFGDAGRLQQVLTNLLSNALKFTAPAARCGWHWTSKTSDCGYACRTAAWALRPTSCRTCSTVFGRPMQAPRVVSVGWAWACRSRASWWICMAAVWARPAKAKARDRCSPSCCHSSTASAIYVRPRQKPSRSARCRPIVMDDWRACACYWSTTTRIHARR